LTKQNNWRKAGLGMVSLPKIKRLKRSILGVWMLCALLLLVNTSAYGVSYSYVINSDSTTDTPQNTHYYLYIPSSLASGTYVCRNYGNYINTAGALNLKTYPITVKYVYSIGNPDEDVVKNYPGLTVSNCASDGTITGTAVSKTFSQGDTGTGYVTMNANEGLRFDFFTGKWYWRNWLGNHKNRAFIGTITITFELDETSPDAPVLTVKNVGESGVVKLGATVHAQKPVLLQWDTPEDQATVLADGTTIGPGAVTSYKLEIYQNKSLIHSELITANSSGNTFLADLPEGEYVLRLRASDEDGNESLPSNSVNLVVDRSVAPVTLTDDGVKIDGNNLNVTWKPVVDPSDIQAYQVAWTTTRQAPGEAYLTTTEAQALCTNLALSQSYFVWVRAVDQVGNIGAWRAAGPFNLSGKAVAVTALPEATLNNDNEPQYQVKLQINSLLSGDYLIERKPAGAGARETIANLTHEELAAGNFQLIDRGLLKHGEYVYYVTHQSGTTAATYQSATVTIPNIVARFTVIGPDDATTTDSFTQSFNLSTGTDYEGDSLKFKVWYRSGGGQAKSSGPFAAGPVSVTFPSAGTWEWWVEVGEFADDRLVGAHAMAISQVVFVRNSTAYLSDGTAVAKAQPRYETSAPGFGKALRIEYKSRVSPTNPFFTDGVADWTLTAATGTAATVASVAGGDFGGKIARITVGAGGKLGNQIQFYKALGTVSLGTKIAGKIRIRASAATNDVLFKCCDDSAPTKVFSSQILNLTTEYQVFKFNTITAADATARIGLDLGNVPAGTVLEIDYICGEKGKVHPTSPHDSARSLEYLKIPTQAMSPAAGTWEQLVYIDAAVKRRGVSLWNRIFSIPRANGDAGINVYHETSSGSWDLETFNDSGKGSWLANPISDVATKENQWYRFRVTWSAAETKLQIFEAATGTLVAKRKKSNPRLPSGFAAYAYVGSMGTDSFPETLYDDLRISNTVRTDSPDFTKPLPVDEATILKMNFDGTLESEYCQPATRNLTITSSTAAAISLPAYFETTPGKALQLAATVNLANPVAGYSWTPGDGGAAFTGATPTYIYSKVGDYPLSLTVTDTAGRAYTAATTVKVRNSASGTLVVNENWSGTQLVTGNLVVASGATLTIQTGTTVYMAAGSSLKIEGNLQASGANQGIVIRTEDNSPWQGIIISGSGKATLNGVTIQGAKTGIACIGSGIVTLGDSTIQNCQTALHGYGGSIKASNCVFKNNRIYGVKEDNGCNPVLIKCQFRNNGINYYDGQLYCLTIKQLNTGLNSENTYYEEAK
jgi:hypothetical protein